MRALGYVHAQERYLRNGPDAPDGGRRACRTVRADRDGHRQGASLAPHARTRACATCDAIAGDRRAQLEAYVDGVNAGLRRPRASARGLTCCCAANRAPGRRPTRRWWASRCTSTCRMRPTSANWRSGGCSGVVPPALFALLARDGTQLGCTAGRAPRAAMPCCPTPRRWICGRLPMPAARVRSRCDVPSRAKSAATTSPSSGARTRDGRAIVADDMHLGLRVPNIWFRARLRYADRACTRRPRRRRRGSPCPACRWWSSAATAMSPGASPTAMRDIADWARRAAMRARQVAAAQRR